MGIHLLTTWVYPRKINFLYSFTSHWTLSYFVLSLLMMLPLSSISANDIYDTAESLACPVDTIPPVITNCPSDTVIAFDTSLCGAVLSWPAIIATDNCDPMPTLTSNYASGDTFHNSDLVVITATDSVGLTTTCSFMVTLTGIQFAITNCPSAVIKQANNNCQAAATWISPTILDHCNSNPTLDSSHVSGSLFELDTTDVVYILSNSLGNSDTCKFQVIVNDTIKPTLSGCDLDTTIYSNTCFAIYSWDTLGIVATDNCDAILIPDSFYQSNDTFPQGTTTVTYTAKDASNNTGHCSFDVTVLDSFPPVVNYCPNDTVITILAGCDTVVSWNEPIFVDGCDTMLTMTANFSPGSSFTTGIYTIAYQAMDSSGNIGNCQFQLTVKDNQPPEMTPCPNDATIQVLANCQASFAYTLPDATDLCSGTITPIATPNTTVFGVGIHPITITATDAGGNSTSCSFTITAEDHASPTTTCPQSIEINADGTIISDPDQIISKITAAGCNMPIVEFDFPPIVDNCEVMLTDSSVLTASFPIGTTIYTYNYSDPYGNGQACTFQVDVTAHMQTTTISASQNPVCPGTNVMLSTSNTSPTAQFLWSGPFSYTSNSPTPTITNFGFQNIGEYSVTITDGGCQLEPVAPFLLTMTQNIAANDDAVSLLFNSKDTFDVLINDELKNQPPSLFIDQNPLNGTAEVSGTTIIYTPDMGYSGADQIFYKVCVANCPSICATAQVNIDVNFVANTDTCLIPTLITPNDDNLNDGLILDCLTSTNESSKILIYNQWGGLVFKAEPYLNDWTGHLEGNQDKPLPDGTYFYIFWKDKESTPQKGFITLFR
ncbi:MAG TPA: HYR domain-containing protein [Saprospiraceae bacterium]|nr:HYR domain-containing protein [Saprospiraceae bacterium]